MPAARLRSACESDCDARAAVGQRCAVAATVPSSPGRARGFEPWRLVRGGDVRKRILARGDLLRDQSAGPTERLRGALPRGSRRTRARSVRGRGCAAAGAAGCGGASRLQRRCPAGSSRRPPSGRSGSAARAAAVSVCPVTSASTAAPPVSAPRRRSAASRPAPAFPFVRRRGSAVRLRAIARTRSLASGSERAGSRPSR